METKKEFTKEDMEILIGEDGLKRYYHKIKKILKEYMDLDEEYYSLISIWIIGTYLHKHFPSYPYLYFNATKSSGKTRMLKIISNLAKNGKVAGSMTESVLFRTAKNRTICIDEFEKMDAKGNENLKLLLNSAYKRGIQVERMKKDKDEGYGVWLWILIYAYGYFNLGLISSSLLAQFFFQKKTDVVKCQLVKVGISVGANYEGAQGA